MGKGHNEINPSTLMFTWYKCWMLNTNVSIICKGCAPCLWSTFSKHIFENNLTNRSYFLEKGRAYSLVGFKPPCGRDWLSIWLWGDSCIIQRYKLVNNLSVFRVNSDPTRKVVYQQNIMKKLTQLRMPRNLASLYKMNTSIKHNEIW